ncbi:MAG: choice-of-anchor I family protein [Oscillospiraceae bacterium]|nr:choice-of-anchor I family protein [Oscillospiraceae bacterium]
MAHAAETKIDGYENGNGVDLTKISSYVSGISNPEGGVAEIVSYDAVNNNAWVVNGATGMLDILDLNGVTCGTSDAITATSLDIKAMAAELMPGFHYGDMTSVSVNSDLGLVAVALQAEDYDAAGCVGILNTDGELLAMMEAGFQPDMVTFTPDGTKILVANEGEPREGFGDGVTDPAGSVTVIWLNAEDPASSSHKNVGFEAFDGKREELVASGVMMVKGNAPSVDFEPEYITCDDTTAYIVLQEANAVAVLDLVSGTYTGVYALGYQDLSLEENALDLVEDGVYAANTYPDAVAAHMPDGIAMYDVNGITYLVTANEGDAREWGSDENEYCNEIKETLIATDGSEAEKVRVIDPEVTDGMPDGKQVLFSSRSFSIFRVEEDGLTQVFDSGKAFEELTASYIPEYFNCSNDDNEHDSRSPKKGPEPESVIVGTVGNDLYAFVALERISGIMAYKINTEAETASYVNYINTRNFSENPENVNEENPGYYMTGDVAPEGMYLINTGDTCVLLAAFEVSGTVSAYAVGGDVTHNFVDGVCTKCNEAVVVDVTEPAEATESVEATDPISEVVTEENTPNMVWIVVVGAIAIALLVVIIRKRK